jgi:hypothetical protein
MATRRIPTAVLDGYLKLIRLPLDGTVRLLTRDRGRAAGMTLALDRWDATVRRLAGTALGSDELRQDAARRRAAAGEREQALELRTEATRRSRQADERLVGTIGQADRRRQASARRAQQKRRLAEEQRTEKSRRLSAAESRRKTATRNAAAKTQEAVEERGKKTRLEQLDREATVLAEQERALNARDEASRLRTAAGAAKAARKSG